MNVEKCCALKLKIVLFCAYIEWFILNYKDQTDSILSRNVLCGNIIPKTCVPQGRHIKGMQLLESLCLGMKMLYW